MGFEILNDLKKKAGLTTKQLSDISNVPKGTIDKILNGQTTNPAYETVVALANALECSVDVFADNALQQSKSSKHQEMNLIIEKYDQLNDEYKKFIENQINQLLELQNKV